MARGRPGVTYYKPAGVPMRSLSEVRLALDEYEALRLADYEGLYHDEAASMMQISRQTFGRIIGAARKKLAEALLEGKAIRLERATDYVDVTISKQSNLSR